MGEAEFQFVSPRRPSFCNRYWRPASPLSHGVRQRSSSDATRACGFQSAGGGSAFHPPPLSLSELINRKHGVPLQSSWCAACAAGFDRPFQSAADLGEIRSPPETPVRSRTHRASHRRGRRANLQDPSTDSTAASFSGWCTVSDYALSCRRRRRFCRGYSKVENSGVVTALD